MSAESIVVQCTSCGKKFRGAAKLAGRTVKCPACSATIAVPATAASPAAPPRVAPPPRVPAAAMPAASGTEWPPQEHAEWSPPDIAGAAACEAGIAGGHEAAAPIPSPIYTPPPGAHLSTPFAPVAARKPMNVKLIAIIGGSVLAVAAIGLVLYLFVFVSPERQLLGTWKVKPPENDPFFKDMSMEITFQKGGKFTGSSSFGPLKTEVTGTWELNGKKLTTKADIPVRFGPAAAAGTNTRTETMEIIELNSSTLKLKKDGERERDTMEFVRK